jgi:sugar lactone lactonase YvrE
LPDGSIGNGIRFNSREEMMIADYTNHNILKVDMASKQINVYAHDSTMNQPNDIAIDSKDRLYASDPNWKANTGRIWRIDTNGKMTILEDNMGTTNGIEVSPDQKTLYVNESVQRKVWAYDLSEEGVISNKRLLIEFPDFGMDGMRCDIDGNLYIARHGKGTVAKVSPAGKLVREIKLNGTKPSNIAFGGKDGRMAYVTLQDRGNIESFPVESPGREWRKK